ncbi:MAG TPA: lysophospholipid acyltransferase family protein [Candidatus Thermoplasmatota archaeon]|nr:lysophospholipid acyltransferase family protein [Candidatus Thermoplasmatota archaeon]
MEEPDREAIEKVARRLRKLRSYFRLHVEGLERIPPGPVVLVANHTGWAGLDYAMLFLSVYDGTGRIPRVAVHPSYFRVAPLRPRAEKLGFYEVSVQTSTRILDEKGAVCFFPEGEDGNFKPIWKRYQLQPFKPGFARVALASLAPIVPISVVGGEDANPTVGRLAPLEDILDVPIPIPLSILPLPAKWRIHVNEPIDPHQYLERGTPDDDTAQTIAQDVREILQRDVRRQLDERGNPFV